MVTRRLSHNPGAQAEARVPSTIGKAADGPVPPPLVDGSSDVEEGLWGRRCGASGGPCEGSVQGAGKGLGEGRH